MKKYAPELNKVDVQDKVILYEVLGFILAIVICWLTELIDPPFSFAQVIIETVSISLLGYLVISNTTNIIRRIKYLEGFYVVCAECKQVRIKEKWCPIEELVVHKSDIRISHSICPPCAQKLYGDLYDKS
jgi:hypothetical protein